MTFVNNWLRQLALAEGALSADLDLPDGTYLLTVSDAPGAAATRWEYLQAVVASGSATLTRGQEGTADQEWPDGSWIYCSVTAGVINDLFSQLDAQAAQISALADRVTALEYSVPAVLRVTIGGGASVVGFVQDDYGSVAPAQLNVPGQGPHAVALVNVDTPSEPYFTINFRGHFPVGSIVSMDVEGVGVLNVADGFAANSADVVGDITTYSWEVVGPDWFSAIGQTRTVAITFAAA